MNKDIMRACGFHKEVAAVESGLCPICAKPVGEFREATISGMCQACQDTIFSPQEGQNEQS